MLAASSEIELGAENFDAVVSSVRARLKPYAAKTTLIRLADYFAYYNDHTGKRWLKENANVFKAAYKRATESRSVAEIQGLLSKVGDAHARLLGEEILLSGTRATEALTRRGDYVVGKGGAERKVFGRALLTDSQRRERCTYSKLWSELRRVGLKPHSLRKAFATEVARSGRVGEAELLRIMGWTSMQTATSYLQPLRDEKLQSIVNSVIGGNNDD